MAELTDEPDQPQRPAPRKQVVSPGDPYTQGFIAEEDGVPESGNPHKPDSEASDLWIAGWYDAHHK